MGQRLLEISVDFITTLLLPPLGNRPRPYEVTKDAVPVDAKVVSVRQSQYRVDVVEVTLSHPSWSDEPPRTRLHPEFTTFPAKGVVACTCGVSKVSCGTCGSMVIDCPNCGKELQRP